jgi:CobQ-like glutamine amidotransferase family enzyme
MSQIIRLFPSRLNLNGDQANALVLQKRAEWSGLAIDVIDYEEVSTLTPLMERLKDSNASTMLILGHGSRAAMASISHLKTEILQLLASCKQRGQTALIVGSSTEWLLDHASGERVSEFWTGSVGYEDCDSEIFGYLNSEAKLDAIHSDGSLLYTLLHGPLLSKSTDLADHLILKLTGSKVLMQNAEEIAGYEAEAIKTARG